MPSRRCGKCDVNWAGTWPENRLCPACENPTTYNGRNDPDEISESQLNHLKFDAYYAKREKAREREATELLKTAEQGMVDELEQAAAAVQSPPDGPPQQPIESD